MKTKSYNVYSFAELQGPARQKAIDEHRQFIDFDTWDSAIKRAESGESLQFVAQDGYHGSTGWCVIGPKGGIVLKCEKEIQARNTADSLNQLIDERTHAGLANNLTPAIQSINSAIMLLVELQHGFVKGAGHWDHQINARIESLKARKEKLQSLVPVQA